MVPPGLPDGGDLERVLGPLRADLGRTALLFDLDGTLAPIIERPEDVRVPDRTRAALEALRPRVGLLGFVSGRALEDVQRIVAMDGCAWAGNHGLQVQLPGREPELVPPAVPYMPAVRAFAGRWAAEDLTPHGVWLEDKGASLTFHYRTAPDPAAAVAFLDAEVAPAAREAGLVARGGRMVVEVLPPAKVDKGTAVRALVEEAGLPVACYVGDDRTDMDAWRALRELAGEGRLERAVCVAAAGAEVPPEVRAGADLEVAGPDGSLALIRWLAGDHDPPGSAAPQS